MKHISPPPLIQIIDDDGLPATGWKIYTYQAGTTTPLATYTDADGATANTNPVVLDAYGMASIWLNNQFYKFVLKDADDNTIQTVDDIGWGYIFQDDNTWTGTNTFNGEVTFSADINGNITFTGSVQINTDLYVVQDLTVDGTVTLTDIVADSITVPLITLSTGETIYTESGILKLTSNTNITFTTDLGGTPRTFDFREDGTLRLPVETPVNDLDAASKGYVDDAITSGIGSGLIPVAAGAVVSNALASGSVGVASVVHSTTGHYTITTSDSAATTGKKIVMTTLRNESPDLDRNYTALPYVTAVNTFVVMTGGGNSYAVIDKDFNFVVYHLP
jgi:hypothetical protein